jgi:hypothetical protein
MTARGYLASLFTFALSGFALIAGMGLVVDGYGVFGTRLIPASRFAPDLRLSTSGDRVTKAIEIAERQGDRILFLGDSRTQHGLDPDAPVLDGEKAYNAALAAASLSEQLVVLDHALAHEPQVRHIVWGLTLEEFPLAIATSSDYPDSAFAGRSITSGLLRHLFALDRMASSWRALFEAPRRVRASMKRNGVAAFDGDPIEGPSIAMRFEKELAGTARELGGPLPQDGIERAHAVLANRLRELKAAGIDVDLVIVPMHVWRLEFLRLIGVEAQHEAWKRRIARSVEALAATPGIGRIRLFDFARPHPFTEQSPFGPPPPHMRRFFLETSHFYPWLGEKILARLFDKEGEGEASSFGSEIGAFSIDADIASAKADLDAWEASHPQDVGYVRRLVSKR